MGAIWSLKFLNLYLIYTSCAGRFKNNLNLDFWAMNSIIPSQKRVRKLTVLIFLLIPFFAFGQSEILVNGGAENSLTGWVEAEKDWAATNFAFTSQEGSNHFLPNDQHGGIGNQHILEQNIDVSSDATAIDNGNVTTSFSGYIITNGADQGKIMIEFLNTSDAAIETFDIGFQTVTNWTEFTDNRTVPSGTRTIKITLTTVAGNGSFTDVAYDAMSLTKTVDTNPEILVEGNSTEISDGDSSPTSGDNTDFGSVTAAGGTISKSFTISNTGSAGLSLSGSPIVAISGSHAGDFTVTSQPSSSIADGNSDTFTIEFDPSAKGTRTAEVSIDNNDSDENPYNFDIQGTGANTAPATADAEVFGYQNEVNTISTSTFSFSDADGSDALSSVEITSLPATGTLANDANDNGVVDGGEALSANDAVSKADLDAGRLIWDAPDNSGYQIDSFNFYRIRRYGSVFGSYYKPDAGCYQRAD